CHMDTISAAAAVTGARHLRTARNGQDAAVAWSGDRTGVAVVCDGCGSGASSEVGARLGAQLVLALIRQQLAHAPAPEIWPAVRAKLVAELARIADAMPGPRDQVVHDHFLFTIVAAVRRDDDVCVWALGDGAYAFGDRAHVLGPFADNQPPYAGYDLLGMPQPSHLEVASAACGSVIVATDGIDELANLATPKLMSHPDALRRHLAVLARSSERIDWEARRIDRVPAALQDDGAVAILRWL
ncbi:MAG: protein phosphatase 2C domain-containing protein, partial [Kofleriaceae bacterium]